MVNSRNKGRRGESKAIDLLTSRDYTIVADLTAGKASCDLLAEKCGITFAVEVKNREIINMAAFRAQARKQARGKQRWMLLVKIAGTTSWLMERQGARPAIWHEVAT
jgi:Holliday junction resolvase-like predicted endonuclease